MGDYQLLTWGGNGAIRRCECAILSFTTEKTRVLPACWLHLTLTDWKTKSTDDRRGYASYLLARLANWPSVQMAHTIVKKTQNFRQGCLSETEDEEGDQQQVPDEEIKLSYEIKEKTKYKWQPEWRAIMLVHEEGGTRIRLTLWPRWKMPCNLTLLVWCSFSLVFKLRHCTASFYRRRCTAPITSYG